MNAQPPYLEQEVVTVVRRYNPYYGDYRLCECGHDYHRHFDSYENMKAVGCKYCACQTFREFTGSIEQVRQNVMKRWPEGYDRLVEEMGPNCPMKTFFTFLLELNFTLKHHDT